MSEPTTDSPERAAHLREQGAAIAYARHRKRLSQRQAAALFGVALNTVSKWETGIRACPPWVRHRIVKEWNGDPELLGPEADMCPHCKRKW
jgi:DNA-binding transcriptional regulator YiaG